MESSRKPSAGVILIGVLALLGSAIVLLIGIVMLVMPLIVPIPQTADSPFTPGLFKAIMLLGSLFYLGPAIWGILTGIGLFRLKEWARISTIVFSVLLVLMMGFGGLFMLFIPIPTPPNQAADPAVTHGVRVFMGVFSLSLVSLGVWWLIFFNRAKVKQQFLRLPAITATPGPEVSYSEPPLAPLPVAAPRGPQRPLSFTIIAWLLLIGCFYLPANLWLRPPMILFTKVLTGWASSAYLLVIAAVSLYVGIGLLRLKPAARSVGVYFFSFFLLNSIIAFLAPGSRARLHEILQRSREMYPWMRFPSGQQFDFPFDMTPFLWIGLLVGVTASLLQLYFLITRKEAFELAAAAARARNAAPLSGSSTSS